MPSHASDAPISRHHLDIDQPSVACPAPLTPPPENDGDQELGRTTSQQRFAGDDGVSRQPESDNTAAGMSLMQEESMYTSPDLYEEKMHTEAVGGTMELDVPNNDAICDDQNFKAAGDTRTSGYDVRPIMDSVESANCRPASRRKDVDEETKVVVESFSGIPSPSSEPSPEDHIQGIRDARAGVPSIDQKLDWTSDLKEWDFSRRRLRPQYPSATFQPYSKFKGTQQSDRQIYNVEVTILTVDIEQSTMSGYLQICGLTPDHPTLTTFFTGEIIGGPDQKYSFRTRDPGWGASDKTDLTHWARFPPWRPLSLQAKRNINFVYPLNHENWWQQEHIFMRWKEHFLVPDYKLKSIQGASFEGFYYICFNQVEGRVSGIYFHSKSEKYQQLELKHEGQQGVWGKGVCPSIEFR